MNKNGFTFIELLAVIILIAVVSVIAIPSMKLANKKIEKKNYETKKELILNAATLYGDDNKDIILDSNTTYTDPSNNIAYPSITINVGTLLNKGYINKDKGLKTNDVKNPITGESLLNKTITIYYKNNRVYAILNFN